MVEVISFGGSVQKQVLSGFGVEKAAHGIELTEIQSENFLSTCALWFWNFVTFLRCKRRKRSRVRVARFSSKGSHPKPRTCMDSFGIVETLASFSNSESKMENDPNTSSDLLRDSAFRRTPAVRPETELTFLHRSYLFLNLCLLSALGCIVIFVIGLTLPSPISNALISASSAMGLLTMLMSVACSFFVTTRLHGIRWGIIYALITATIAGWLVLFLLRQELSGILRRNGFHVATLSATKNTQRN